MHLLIKLEKSKKNFAFLDFFNVKLDFAILLRSTSQKNSRKLVTAKRSWTLLLHALYYNKRRPRNTQKFFLSSQP